MFSFWKKNPPRGLAKWLGYGLVLLAPGSFVILPALWLARLIGGQAAR